VVQMVDPAEEMLTIKIVGDGMFQKLMTPGQLWAEEREMQP